nr:MAG TPA: hypothetical protein [Caudoviricetes sp.]
MRYGNDICNMGFDCRNRGGVPFIPFEKMGRY